MSKHSKAKDFTKFDFFFNIIFFTYGTVLEKPGWLVLHGCGYSSHSTKIICEYKFWWGGGSTRLITHPSEVEQMLLNLGWISQLHPQCTRYRFEEKSSLG